MVLIMLLVFCSYGLELVEQIGGCKDVGIVLSDLFLNLTNMTLHIRMISVLGVIFRAFSFLLYSW